MDKRVVTATAVEHTDVRGKTTLFVKLENGKQSYFVNVGQRTFDTVREMEAPEAQLSIEFTESAEEIVNEKTKGGKK